MYSGCRLDYAAHNLSCCSMRTHVWRKQFTRLSQRGQRLPFQPKRSFASLGRHLEAHASPNQEATTDTAPSESVSSSPSSRRAARSNRRPKEVAPFTVPDWFLRHNVRLHAPDPPAPSATEPANEARCWTLVDRDSGHTILTLPFTVPKPDEANDSSAAKEEETVKKDSDIARAINHLTPTPAPASPDPRLLFSLQLQLLLNAAFSKVGPQHTRFVKANLDLHTRDFYAHKELDAFVHHMADLVGADLIQLDANDFAELGQEYVEPRNYASGSISSLAYDTFKGVVAARRPSIQIETDDAPNDQGHDDGDAEHGAGFAPSSAPSMGDLEGMFDWLKNNQSAVHKALSQAGASGGGIIPISISEMPPSRDKPSSSADSRSRNAPISTWDELKMATLLDTIIDSVQIKKDSPPATDTLKSFLYDSFSVKKDDAASVPTQASLERFLADFLAKKIDSASQQHKLDWSFENKSGASKPSQHSPKTIIHIKDMNHIRDEPQGDALIYRLARVVLRRRADGEQIVIVGTTASSTHAPPLNSQDDDEPYFRYMQYPSASGAAKIVSQQLMMAPQMQQSQERTVAEPGYHRLFDINMRHIHTMVGRLDLPVSDKFFSADTRAHFNIPATSKLGDMALPQDEVQRIVLCADSLRTLYTNSPLLETFHIALATMLVSTIDSTLSPLVNSVSFSSVIPPARARGDAQPESDGTKPSSPPKLDMDKLKKSCSKHETRLLSGVVDPASLRTTFDDVHADPSTIESLKLLTSLTLLRPEAFSYGILAADRLPGLLLYGPPGTGKTLLAKAVAKESSATVLEVSGAQVYEKYVGEGEKMVNAVFSLAKKLSPCVVFIDEADALFGSRGGANNRTTHREIINQFLRGWDGMDDHSVFMMVATNRPFDLDDAVLRRLPRRLLVDLPLAKDREGILNIHLKGEDLDSAVSLSDLAKNTPLYSGSDLKNLCVAAALAAVRDENNLLEAARKEGNTEFKLPPRRTLAPSHFEKALQEISASVSEDMATLGAIRKFDEQYGEKRARTKKAGYGFGLGGSNAIDESGARVRPDEPSR
jgi:SpoVK/Ycf46/Vps4 family AAA+-type ATPase